MRQQEKFKERVREVHKQIAKDFDYDYLESEDLMFVWVNDSNKLIPVSQKYQFPLKETTQWEKQTSNS